MAGTIITPGGTTGLNAQMWRRTIKPGLYQRAKMLPVVERGEKPLTTQNIRLLTRVAGSVLGQSADGTGLTYLNPIGTAVALNAVGNHVPVGWSRNESAQLDVKLASALRGTVEDALTELTESTLAAAIATLTLPAISAPKMTGDVLRKAVANLMGNTFGNAEPGGAEQVYGFFSHTQLPALGDIPEYNNAEYRGDSENPYVKGVWMKGGGVGLAMVSTVVYFDGASWNNCVFQSDAFIASWNEEPDVVEDSAELQTRLIAYNNLASGVQYDRKALRVLTSDSQL